jgi:sigma-B regulation protein RsbU (phosphoserine phosphatase)
MKGLLASGRSGREIAYAELLIELMEAFAKTTDLRETLYGALRRIAEAMGAEAGSLFQLEGEFDDPAARLICRASYGPVDMRGVELPAHAGIVGRALERDAPQLIDDPHRDPDFVPPHSLGIDFEVRSLLVAPVTFRGQRFGAVQLFNKLDSGRFERSDAKALATLAAAAGLAIRNAQLTQDLVEQTRLKRELELAAVVQRNLLPPPSAPDAPIHGLSRAARGVGGDFYDILPLREGRIAFALADVSGKGMNAALIMVKVATLFRSLARRVRDPGRLLARIEEELCDSLTQGMFVTMVVGIYDHSHRHVRFANAGHLPPLLRDRHGRFHAYPPSDPPLGVQSRLEGRRYRETQFKLGGGSLYLYSDGATEARHPDGSQVGVEGLQALLDLQTEQPAAERLDRVATALDGGMAELRDDLTLLVIEEASGRKTPLQQRPRRRNANLLVEQTLPAQPQQLKIVRRLVLAAARQAGAPSGWGQDFALAVDEACQNIIRHAYHDRPDGRIELRIRRSRGRLSAELVDFAPQVDEDRCRGRLLEELRPGGLGTHFMHMLTDQVLWRRPPPGAGNRLVLIKSLPLPAVDGKT